MKYLLSHAQDQIVCAVKFLAAYVAIFSKRSTFVLQNICQQKSGLSKWLGTKLAPLQTVPPFAISILLSLLVATFTECSSNTATTTLFLPILAAMVNTCGYAHMPNANTHLLHVFNHIVLVCFSGHNDQNPPAVCDAAMHHCGLSGLHVACGYTTQRHRLFIWKPQSFWHGEIDTLMFPIIIKLKI